MRKKMIALLMLLSATMSYGQTQQPGRGLLACDSVLTHTTLYYSINNGEWIEKSEYKKVGKFLQWALADTLSPIRLQGWTDNSGREEYNRQLSLRRAETVRNYLMRKGVSAQRIAIEGCGIDAQAATDDKARRVELSGGIRLIAVSGPKQEVAPETSQVTFVEEAKQEVAVKQTESVMQNSPVVAEPATPTAHQEQQKPTAPKAETSFNLSRWYIGIGGGVSFGRSTFCSFAMDGTRPGFNVGALGGYKINKLLSAELSLDYTRMDLRTYDCCQLLWLAADGNRYAAPVAGIKNYAYNDLRSVCNLFGLGAHLNINLVSLWNEHSRWSALVSPAIYGVYSSAKLKQLSTGANVTDATSFHFGVGADLGVGYQFTDCFELRLTTGFNYLTGKGIDGLSQEEHKANYVWNTSLKLIFKL